MEQNSGIAYAPMTEEQKELYEKRRALFRKIVDACDGCGLTTAAVVAVLRDVSDQINLCRNSKPMANIMEDMRKSRFYQDSSPAKPE